MLQGPWWSDATARARPAGYAMTTTTTTLHYAVFCTSAIQKRTLIIIEGGTSKLAITVS